MREITVRRLVALSIVLALAGLAILVLGPDRGASPATTPAPTQPGTPPGPADVVAEGRAVPVHAASLSVEVPGTISRIVALGAAVKLGDALVELDPAAADAAVAAAQSALTAAVAQRDAANSAIAEADAAIAAAKAGVDQATAGIASAQAGVDRARAGVDQAQAARDLVPDAASNAQKRQANAVLAGAQASLTAANAAVDAARAALALAQAQVTSATAARTTAQATTDAADAERRRAEAGVTAAEVARSRETVVAPFDGIVAGVAGHPGEVVVPGLPIVRVADLGAWTFETTDLSGSAASKIAVGDSATISVQDALGVELAGTVTRIAAYGDDRLGDVVFRVILTPSGPVPAAIRWNMVVTITIHPRNQA